VHADRCRLLAQLVDEQSGVEVVDSAISFQQSAISFQLNRLLNAGGLRAECRIRRVAAVVTSSMIVCDHFGK